MLGSVQDREIVLEKTSKTLLMVSEIRGEGRKDLHYLKEFNITANKFFKRIRMKRTFTIFLLAFSPLLANAQAFENYENMKNVDAMIMTSKMFKMLAKVDLSEGEKEARQYLKLIENLDEIRMFTSGDSQVRNQMARDVENYLQKDSLEQLMQVNEDGKNIRFYSKPGKNDSVVSELFMFMEGQNEGKPISVILSITGDIDLSQLSKLTSDLKIPGAEELENIEKTQEK